MKDQTMSKYAKHDLVIPEGTRLGADSQDRIIGWGASIGDNFVSEAPIRICVQSDEDAPVNRNTVFEGSAKIQSRSAIGVTRSPNGAVLFKGKTEIGYYSLIAADAEFLYTDIYEGLGATIGSSVRFERDVTFAAWALIGQQCTFYGKATFKYGADIGASVAFKGGLNYRGHEVLKLSQLDSVDGSGRRIKVLLVKDKKGKLQTIIEAGCYFGTLRTFVTRARRQDKPYYAHAVPAFANAVKAVYIESTKKCV